MHSLDETREAFRQQLTVVESDFNNIADLSAESSLPNWTIGVLVGHITISLKLSKMLNAAQPEPHQTQTSFKEWMRRTSEFSDEIDAISQGYAKKRSGQDLTDQFREGAQEARDFLDIVDESLRIVLPAWDVWVSIEDFLLGRVVELTVHGMDLSRSIGSATQPAAIAASMVSELLDEDFGNPRPEGLGDDATWISVATGREHHEDDRLPLFN